MLLVKLMLNSSVSTMNTKLMCIDITNFYLNTPLEWYEYLKMKLTNISQEVTNKYNLKLKATADKYVYIKVDKGMYGIPQAGILTLNLLKECLNKHRYFQDNIVPGLRKHRW